MNLKEQHETLTTIGREVRLKAQQKKLEEESNMRFIARFRGKEAEEIISACKKMGIGNQVSYNDFAKTAVLKELRFLKGQLETLLKERAERESSDE